MISSANGGAKTRTRILNEAKREYDDAKSGKCKKRKRHETDEESEENEEDEEMCEEEERCEECGAPLNEDGECEDSCGECDCGICPDCEAQARIYGENAEKVDEKEEKSDASEIMKVQTTNRPSVRSSSNEKHHRSIYHLTFCKSKVLVCVLQCTKFIV